MTKQPRRHTVKATLQVFTLSKAGTSLELEVFEQQARSKRRKLGTVIIGRGSITWRRAREQNGYRVSWPAFAAFMES